jgi:hypothetical protein
MTFDSFECAIHAMAPQFAHRECRLLGYGVEIRAPFSKQRACSGAVGECYGERQGKGDRRTLR